MLLIVLFCLMKIKLFLSLFQGAPRNQPQPRPTTPRTTMPPVVVTEPPPPRPPPTNRPNICDIPYNAAVRGKFRHKINPEICNFFSYSMGILNI